MAGGCPPSESSGWVGDIGKDAVNACLSPALACVASHRVYPPQVSAYPEGSPSAPLFVVPVTVVKPAAVESPTLSLQAACTPGKLLRRFWSPPRGATWVDVTVTDLRAGDAKAKDSAPHLYVLHCIQLLPNTPYRDQEVRQQLAAGVQVPTSSDASLRLTNQPLSLNCPPPFLSLPRATAAEVLLPLAWRQEAKIGRAHV